MGVNCFDVPTSECAIRSQKRNGAKGEKSNEIDQMKKTEKTSKK